MAGIDFKQTSLELLNKLRNFQDHSGEGIRVLASLESSTRRLLKHLNLDHSDTTGRELHYALLSKYSRDSALLDRALNINQVSNLEDKKRKAIILVGHHCQLGEVWAVKKTIVRQVVKSQKPKKTVKAMGYRSLDSLLKHEDICKIALTAEALESSAWKLKFRKNLEKLDTSKYEMRKVTIIDAILPGSSGVECIVSNELGAVGFSLGNISPGQTTLDLALRLLTGVNSLTHGKQVSFGHLHPSLHWWTTNLHLIHHTDDGDVSCNVFDVAKSVTAGGHFEARTLEHVYQSLANYLFEKVRDIQPSFLGETDPLDHELRSHKFAPEFDLVGVE